jgi:exopolysaccharide production protein ExoZ
MVLASIQALRFAAALLVLFFHMGLMRYGFKGVDLFFVISGFVLYFNYHFRPSNTPALRKKYFIHRLTKIYLLYWTVLLVLYILAPFPLDLSLLGTILLIPGHNPVLATSWSLSYELYFYGLMGITLFYVPVRWHKRLFFTAFILSAGIKLMNSFGVPLRGTALYFLAGPNLWEFLCGILAGAVFCQSPVRSDKSPYLPVSVVLLIAFCVLPVPLTAFYYHFVYGSIATLLVITAALAEQRRPWRGPVKKWVIRAGSASYAMYLFAPVVHHFIDLPTLPRKLLLLGILILVSLLVNQFYEEKLLRVVRGWWSTNAKVQPKEAGPLSN